MDVVDGILEIWGASNRWTEINNLLATGASIWRVNPERDGLTRLVGDEAQATYVSATSTPDAAALELTEAWSNAFGRNGNASHAWAHAIKAVEDVMIPIVMPKNGKATLGSVVGELGGLGGDQWEFLLPGDDESHCVAPLVAMLKLIWPNHDRHGGPNPKRTPSEEEARAVVTLAATIVQWHREGWVVRRR